MKSEKMHSKVVSLFRSIQNYYDWKRRTLLTKLYFLNKDKYYINTNSPAGEIKLEVDSEWGRAYKYATGAMYEPLLMTKLYEHLSRNDVFYNIGARWGIFSLFAEKCELDPEDVHSFEADDHAFEILRRNVGNHHVINNVYVSDSDGRKSITLDSYIDTNDMATVIKMDIEGAELKALRGAETLLEQQMPTLFIEVHPEYIKDMGGTQQELITILTDSGYNLKIARTDSNKPEFEPIDNKPLPSNPKHGNYRLLAL